MGYAQDGIGSVIVLVVGVIFLNSEMGTESIMETYYTMEPIAYEETFQREGTTEMWQLAWPPRVTVPQVQVGLKNVDTVEGEFLVNVSFDDGIERRNKHAQLVLMPGQEETVFVDSPIPGPQTIEVAVAPPHKRVERQREVEISYTYFDKFWEMRTKFLGR